MAVPFLEFTATPNGRFEFQKRHQLFIRVHDETLSVAAIPLRRKHAGDFKEW